MPRVTKLDPAVHKLIVDLIGAGNYLETAAAAAGVSSSTLRDWLRRGARESDGIYHELHAAVERATAEAEAKDVVSISKAAAAGEWRASAWKLERTRPERFGQQITVVAKQQATAEVLRLLRDGLTGEEFARVLGVLQSAGGDEATDTH